MFYITSKINQPFCVHNVPILHISWKSIHKLLSYLANKQTDRQQWEQYHTISGGDNYKFKFKLQAKDVLPNINHTQGAKRAE